MYLCRVGVQNHTVAWLRTSKYNCVHVVSSAISPSSHEQVRKYTIESYSKSKEKGKIKTGGRRIRKPKFDQQVIDSFYLSRGFSSLGSGAGATGNGLPFSVLHSARFRRMTTYIIVLTDLCPTRFFQHQSQHAIL